MFQNFDELGELNLNQIQHENNQRNSKNDDSQMLNLKEMPLKDRETFQYITFDSIKRNFYRVFGKPNDAMAEMLFRYLSGCRSESDLSLAKVNYMTFLLKFECLWPKKNDGPYNK
jgi:hypothetical protein